MFAHRSEKTSKNTKKNTGNGSFPKAPLMLPFLPWGCVHHIPEFCLKQVLKEPHFTTQLSLQ